MLTFVAAISSSCGIVSCTLEAADDGLIITSERMCLTSSGGRGRAMLQSVQTFRASYIISADTALYRSSLIGLLSLQGKITARKTSCLMPRHSVLPDALILFDSPCLARCV
ncbi:hypothetical protein NECAME_02462 [Necator americanus]|uniref:Uncharacterized protein n=1 Tax=Necator americanus TaxID=51031 RepID=W2TD61_NECAM|nr:hypothetical protein NECAME_02462 [Necator americanus]ETN79985.1 hypothetical protein NECAME_02462 [Necator americanus]